MTNIEGYRGIGHSNNHDTNPQVGQIEEVKSVDSGRIGFSEILCHTHDQGAGGKPGINNYKQVKEVYDAALAVGLDPERAVRVIDKVLKDQANGPSPTTPPPAQKPK